MTQFDESKVRRDADGQFASKGPAAEDTSVHLSAPTDGAGGDETPAEVAQRHSDEFYGLIAQRAGLQMQVDRVESEIARHDLAQMAMENPQVRYFAIGSGEKGGRRVEWPDIAYDDNSVPISGLRLERSPAPEDSRAYADFEVSPGSRLLDMNRVRSWARSGEAAPPSLEETHRERREQSAAKERASVQAAGDLARQELGPEVSSLRFGQWARRLEYDAALDSRGKVLHKRGARLPSGETDTAFREALDAEVRDLSTSSSKQDWMKAADTRNHETGAFRDAVVHLDRIDRIRPEE